MSQYLERYAEPEARDPHTWAKIKRPLQRVLAVPAYGESPTLAATIEQWLAQWPELLVILVLNRTAGEPNPHINEPLRHAIATIENIDRCLVAERDTPLPSSEGVGLARKIGADIASAMMAEGLIQEKWIHCTDADAHLPEDYFTANTRLFGHTDSGVICHPFRHDISGELALPMALYELRLHDHVLGLREAGSPYGFHSVGSCISIRDDIYQNVRGFPKRSGAEDFYLLNKAAKLTDVLQPTEPLIRLEARRSQRVPFGTGQAVTRLAVDENPKQEPLFYHPHSYRELQQVLQIISEMQLPGALPEHSRAILADMGLEKALEHCRRQSSDIEGFLRHFHQWFDGFRTMRFMHSLRDRHYPDQSFNQLHGDEDPLAVLKNYRGKLGWA